MPELADFQSLYESHAREVFRFALGLSGDRVTAEDLASETFVRVWTARDRVGVTSVRAYLFAIVRNLFLQGLRRERRRVGFEDRIETLETRSPSPLAEAESRQELGSVLAALQRLPEPDRAALLLRAEEDLSYEEISRLLGLSLSAVKVKIHRARLRLAEARQGKEPS